MSTTFRRLFGSLITLMLAVSFAAGQAMAAPASKSTAGSYIVQLGEDPVLAYDGKVPGYPATRPAAGQKVDRNNPDVKNYVNYLDSRHTAVLNSVGGGKKLNDYRYTFNGFAAELTAAQVATLAKTPGVLAVTPNEKRTVDTSSTPAFLGLSKPGGLWDQLGGPARAGEGVVIGIIDSGIWPDSASFADDGSFRPLPRWRGECVTGEAWDASDCSNKVVGARYYNSGFGGGAAIKSAFPYEYLSARDADGHGTHTASTAGGNYGVEAAAEGINLGKISGMAPRARIAIYKVCWGRLEPQAGCYPSDSVAAIEDAAADGVDVINFSISGSQTSVTDPVEIAFLQASSQGVFVAASAGNSGPTPGTVAHNSPWLTTVAASTHDRVYEGAVTLGNGATYTGASLTAGTPVAPIVDSVAAGSELCEPGKLNPSVVTGKIVLCKRGVIARVDKSLAVKQAGGIGMVLYNNPDNSLNADLHYVPTVHVNSAAGLAIKAYIASTANPTAQITAGVQKVGAEAPFMAPFSSRGPNRTNGDLLKPDITAPGVDVLAAYSPASAGRNFDFLSGTSMSSPHIAGIAALLKDRNPAWTPSMIKSAMMTTASQTTNKGNPIDGGPQAYGAGHVTPNSAADPGLVYEAKPADYVAFLCGQKLLNDPRCPAIAIDASNLNLPSIAIGDLAGLQTVTRRVTNVGTTTTTYTASVQAPAGIKVEVSPSSLTIKPGETKAFSVKFTTQSGATYDAYTYGALTWNGGKYKVRSPLAIRPVRLAAPANVVGSGTSGSVSYNVQFGYTGAFAARLHGLVPATEIAGGVAQNATTTHTVQIPAGTELARFSLFNSETNNPANDLDLVVKGPSGAVVGSSGGPSTDEEVNLVKPAAGTYTLEVNGFATNGTTATYTAFVWAVQNASTGNATLTAPTSATVGQSANVTVNWTGLNAGTKYLGTVTYHNVAAPGSYDDGRIGTTVVRVDTP